MAYYHRIPASRLTELLTHFDGQPDDDTNFMSDITVGELRELIRVHREHAWCLEHARWIRHEHEAYVAVPVAWDADLSCTPMREDAIDAAIRAGVK